MIDTGASCSWIDEMHMRSLGLEPRSWEEVHTVQSKGIPIDFAAYEVSLVLGGLATVNSRRFELLIGGQSFINQPFDGLLGRDILNQCRLGWHGPGRNLRFEYD
ncbi:MAG: retropepsin-like aspartic protease [Burkholderiales bacterium]